MDIITTHIHSDFDAFASVIAAQKLYPHAKIVFPGDKDRVLNQFIKDHQPAFTEYRPKDIDYSEVTRLIIVDTRKPDRIGPLLEIAQKEGVSLHIYDHHPPEDNDLEGDIDIYQPYGASITLLVSLLRDKSIAISTQEATIFAMGIYDDTDMLTTVSVTETDFDVMSYLLSQGANLPRVNQYINRDLTPDQLSVLNDLLHNLEVYEYQGVQVGIVAIHFPEYIDNLAYIVQKIRNIVGPSVIIVLASMNGRVHLIARSRLMDIPLGEIASCFGGGGHAHAASAAIGTLTVAEVKQELLQLLERYVRPKAVVADIMNTPPVWVTPETRLEEVCAKLNQFNINNLCVVEDGEVVGIISRRVVDKSMQHGLGERPVEELMETEFSLVSPTLSTESAKRVFLESESRFAPVVENSKLVGVLTRQNIMDLLYRESTLEAQNYDEMISEREYHKKTLVGALRNSLDASIVEKIELIRQKADQLDLNIYAVGGFVRDLILNLKNDDLDIVVEGDAIKLAYELSKMPNIHIKRNPKFNTAKIFFNDGDHVDLASARMEYYERPVALPVVATSSIKLDLARRDFTINAIAVQLNHKNYGRLLDFFGGLRDIKDGQIRVIHSLSFIEDPTRIIRAIRFAHRFDFKIGKQTERFMKAALKMDLFSRLSGERIQAEMKHILQMRRPFEAIQKMVDYKVLQALEPKLRFTYTTKRLYEKTVPFYNWYHYAYIEPPVEEWLLNLIVMLSHSSYQVAENFVRRLRLTNHQIDVVSDAITHSEELVYKLGKEPKPPNSEIYGLCKPRAIETLLLAMAKAETERVPKRIQDYLTKLKLVKVETNGHDLMKMGFKPSPIMKKILDSVHNWRLDGLVTSKAEEEAMIREKFQVPSSRDKL